MKFLTGLLLTFLVSNNVFAINLCDSSCDLTISFPDGGSVDAIKPVTITFGEGGFVNDGAATTAYSAGETLSLAASESIDFQAGGAFDLGSGGNVDYSDILVQSNGVMSLSATGGENKVLIQNMTLLGGCSLTISSNFEVVETGLFHIFDGMVTASEDLSFKNYGSISGLVNFKKATLTLDDTTYDVSGAMLIEADGQVAITSEAVTVEPSKSVIDESPGSETENGGSIDPVTSGTDTASSSDAGSGSGGSGMLNITSLFFMTVLLLVVRLYPRIGRR